MISYDFLLGLARDHGGATKLSMIFYGFNDFQWFPMISYNFINDFIRLHMISYDFICIHMISYDFLWFHMISYDFLWVLMISYDFIWFPMIRYDFKWFPRISYDFLWLHKISYNFLWFLWFPIRNNLGTSHGRPDKLAHMCLAVISYGFLWSLMIFNDCYNFFWLLLISHDFQWLLWFPIISYVSFMISYDFIRFHNISYDFIWQTESTCGRDPQRPWRRCG